MSTLAWQDSALAQAMGLRLQSFHQPTHQGLMGPKTLQFALPESSWAHNPRQLSHEALNPPPADSARPGVDPDSAWGRAAASVDALCAEPKSSQGEQLLRQAGLTSDLIHQLECDQVEAAYGWILLNPPPPPEQMYGPEDAPVPAGGPGAPMYRGGIADMYALALGHSLHTSENILRRAGELIARFPKTWQQIKARRIPLYRAWALVRKTVELPLEVATYLDDEIAPHFHDMPPRLMDQAITNAWATIAPNHLAHHANETLDNRGLQVSNQNTVAGTCQVWGELDIPDAQSLRTFLAQVPKQLLENGTCNTLGQARSQAIGMLARGELLIMPDANNQGPSDQGPSDQSSSGQTVITSTGVSNSADTVKVRMNSLSVPPINIGLYVHFSADQLAHHLNHQGPATQHSEWELADGTFTPDPFSDNEISGIDVTSGAALIEGFTSPVLLAHIQKWCNQNNNTIRTTQVIDLNADYHTTSYQPTKKQREQAIATNWTCAFPTCNRRARTGDIDHITSYANGGLTTSKNLAPLCRRHHRAKTRNQWEYENNGDHYTWRCLTTYIKSKNLVTPIPRPQWWTPPKSPPIAVTPEQQAIQNYNDPPPF